MSVQVGAHYLEKEPGGRGVLLGGVPGVAPAKVAILGGGVAGVNAAQMAVGMRADVTIYDINNERLAELDMFFSIADQDRLRLGDGDRQCGRRGRTGDRRGAGSRRRGAEAGHPRDAEDDEARLGAGRYRHRPGRLFRDLPCRRPMPTRSSRSTASSIIASRTCRARWRGPSTFALNNATLPFAIKLANLGAEEAMRRTRISPPASMYRAARSATRRSPKRSTCLTSRPDA